MKRKSEALKEYSLCMLKRNKDIIKSMWLIDAGSRGMNVINIVILVNDLNNYDDKKAGFLKDHAEEIEKEIESRYKIKMTTTFHLLSEYWEMIRHCSPTTFSEIREGIALYDPSGFFQPIKNLLHSGKIPGTEEAMKDLMRKASGRIRNVEYSLKSRIMEHIFSAVVEAGQAPLIMHGASTPIPKELPSSLEAHFVKSGKLEPEYIRYCERVIKYWKKYEHGEVMVSWEKIDDCMEKGIMFVERMEKLVENM